MVPSCGHKLFRASKPYRTSKTKSNVVIFGYVFYAYVLFVIVHDVVLFLSIVLAADLKLLDLGVGCSAPLSVPLLILWECAFEKVQPRFPNRWAGLRVMSPPLCELRGAGDWRECRTETCLYVRALLFSLKNKMITLEGKISHFYSSFSHHIWSHRLNWDLEMLR